LILMKPEMMEMKTLEMAEVPSVKLRTIGTVHLQHQVAQTSVLKYVETESLSSQPLADVMTTIRMMTMAETMTVLLNLDTLVVVAQPLLPILVPISEEMVLWSYQSVATEMMEMQSMVMDVMAAEQ